MRPADHVMLCLDELDCHMFNWILCVTCTLHAVTGREINRIKVCVCVCYANQTNNITKQLNQKQIIILHLILTVCCSLEKRLTPTVSILCFVIIKSLLFKRLRVWILL